MHTISKELVQKLLNYLATHPYAEVYQMIAELANLKGEEKKKEEVKK